MNILPYRFSTIYDIKFRSNRPLLVYNHEYYRFTCLVLVFNLFWALQFELEFFSLQNCFFFKFCYFKFKKSFFLSSKISNCLF